MSRLPDPAVAIRDAYTRAPAADRLLVAYAVALGQIEGMLDHGVLVMPAGEQVTEISRICDALNIVVSAATHYGPDPGHGGPTLHKGGRETCPGPDCGPDVDAEVVEEDYQHVADYLGLLTEKKRNAVDAEEIARVEEDAAEGREHEAEQQAEIDAERTAQLRAEDISPDLAAQLRSDVQDPCELAAIQLLDAAGLLNTPAFIDAYVSRSTLQVLWITIQVDVIDMAFPEDLTSTQLRLLRIACQLGSRNTDAPAEQSLRALLWGIWEEPDTATLIQAAVRTALAPMPAGGAR